MYFVLTSKKGQNTFLIQTIILFQPLHIYGMLRIQTHYICSVQIPWNLWGFKWHPESKIWQLNWMLGLKKILNRSVIILKFSAIDSLPTNKLSFTLSSFFKLWSNCLPSLTGWRKTGRWATDWTTSVTDCDRSPKRLPKCQLTSKLAV